MGVLAWLDGCVYTARWACRHRLLGMLESLDCLFSEFVVLAGHVFAILWACVCHSLGVSLSLSGRVFAIPWARICHYLGVSFLFPERVFAIPWACICHSLGVSVMFSLINCASLFAVLVSFVWRLLQGEDGGSLQSSMTDQQIEVVWSMVNGDSEGLQQRGEAGDHGVSEVDEGGCLVIQSASPVNTDPFIVEDGRSTTAVILSCPDDPDGTVLVCPEQDTLDGQMSTVVVEYLQGASNVSVDKVSLRIFPCVSVIVRVVTPARDTCVVTPVGELASRWGLFRPMVLDRASRLGTIPFHFSSSN